MVFDGHGKVGEKCANFCKIHLPRNFSAELKQVNSKYSIEAAITKSFIETNEQLHSDKAIDDSLSGTTAVGVYFQGRDIWIANVGDSRAIIVQEHEGKNVARALSSDQTPYRKDERERVKACGARVMSMDQIEGIEPIHENWGDVILGEELDECGDPPRIWNPFGEYPGTAFSRSMGDLIAEELGVFAEPEIIHKRLHNRDKFIIVASDGVFEFLTNQMVADMVGNFSDPLESCKKVVQEAYDLWLQYEIRTDDITIICIFLEGIPMDGDLNDVVNTPSTNVDLTQQQVTRRLRREMSRQRQRHFIMQNETFAITPTESPKAFKADEDDYVVKDHTTTKSEAEASRILSAIRNNFLFDHISPEQQNIMLDVIARVEVKAGDLVIRQGESGDRFYIIDSGIFEVRVSKDEPKIHASLQSVDSQNSLLRKSKGSNFFKQNSISEANLEVEVEFGHLVHVYEPTEFLKPCFGHLALLYSKPRMASVLARTDGILWALDRAVFRKIIVQKSRSEVEKTLRKVEVLKSLNVVQLQQLCEVLTEQEFGPGEYIIRQGELGETFYIIDEGVALVTRVDSETKMPVHIRRLHTYNYFGEGALLLSEPRSANVIAESRVRVLQINQKAFEQVLGPLQHIIDEDRKRREQRPGVPPIADLKILGKVYEDDLGQFNLVKLPASNSTFTIRTVYKSEVNRLKQRVSVIKAAELHKYASENLTLRKSTTVPILMGTYNLPNCVHLVQQVALIGSLSQVLNEKNSFSIDCVRHIAAGIVLGLELLHKVNFLYRALSPELVFLDSRGCAILMEFRLAKIGLEGSTLCGTPEYLSPEQVRNQTHGKAVDFWALGILIYELLHGSSPFAAMSELDVYNNISSHKSNSISFPHSFSPALCDFLDRLLEPNPSERLGSKEDDMSAIKTHQWFAGFDWAGLSRGEFFHPELRRMAHDRILKAARIEGSLRSNRFTFEGDQSQWERF
mmetsp:Transcript_2904/g.4384  ORF Transcript_2904/g.4384 Transcript_2904/m.4384 type:complete len:966 (+) Transcript_2904:142-3039(+)